MDNDPQTKDLPEALVRSVVATIYPDLKPDVCGNTVPFVRITLGRFDYIVMSSWSKGVIGLQVNKVIPGDFGRTEEIHTEWFDILDPDVDPQKFVDEAVEWIRKTSKLTSQTP